MAYVFGDGLDLPEPHRTRAAFAAYEAYLASVRDRLPPGALAFATAPWHYDPSDHRCPHDARVENLTVHEPAAGERGEQRGLEIRVRCLGAYHDGHLELRYSGVRAYELTTPRSDERPGRGGHGDWLRDEVRLAGSGAVIHEVRFERGSRWLIECDDLAVTWHPSAAESAPS